MPEDEAHPLSDPPGAVETIESPATRGPRAGAVGPGGVGPKPEPADRAPSGPRPEQGWTEALLDAEGPVLRMIGEGKSPREQREWFRVILNSIGDGVIATDADGRVVFINPVAEALTGWGAAEAQGAPSGAVFLVVDEATGQAAEDPVARVFGEGAAVASAHHDLLIAREGVTARPIDHVASPIRDASGRVAGVVLVFRDVTERRRGEHALRESERRLRQLADTMPQVVWTASPDGGVDYFNGRWYEYTGMSPDEALAPEGWRAVIHPDDLGALYALRNRAVGRGEVFQAEVRLRDREGAYRWHLVRSGPVLDDAGKVLRRFGTATDIDERKRSEDDARFLAEASAALASMADEKETLGRVARLAVPFFADWCVVDLSGPDDSVRRLAVAHADPAKVALADDLARRHPATFRAPGGPYEVIRTGRSRLVVEIADVELEAVADDPEHLAALRGLGPKSYLSVPLAGQAGTLGAITFVMAESGRRFGPNDLVLAEDLARRAVIAIDNARLTTELKNADRRKDEFLATLAHELRNPLAPIRNALHLLDRPDVEETARAEVRVVIRRQVDHMTRLIDDLLDVSRITRGKVELRKEVVDLADVIRRSVETTRPQVEDQGHTLTVSLPAEPIRLEADPTRLEQIFDNLLNNAAKYTEPGGRIALTADRRGGEVEVRVRDTGIGIAPEKLPTVFDLFMQADRRPDRAQGGLGIGLSLVRSLAEMHGGSVSARSEGPGTGSEFLVRLPVLPASSPTPPEPRVAPGESRPASPSLPRRRVLVVDDNLDAARTMAMLLKRVWGQEVEVAHDGPAAVEAARSFRPDAILLDIGLPGMDGYDVARRLRERPEFARTLIVAMTGWGQEEDRRKSREAGFDRHLVKPVDPDELWAVLAEHGAPS